MKKAISLLLVFAMMLSIMSALMSTSFAAEATTDTVISGELADNDLLAEKTKHERFISEADKYVKVSDDGLITLNLPTRLIRMISAEEYSALLEGISQVNKLIQDGTLIATENAIIYEVSDQELVVQGGNVNKVTWHWWGVRRYASRSAANTIARNLSHLATGVGSVGTVASAFGSYGLVFSIFAGLTAGRISSLSTEISYYNAKTNRGVKIDLRWILTYKVSCQ